MSENTVNEPETVVGSVTVALPIAHAFDVWGARRFIMAERALAGPDTPLGHRCSNMVELIENYTKASTTIQASHIKSRLLQTVQEIAEIKGRKMLAPPLKILEEA